MYICDMLIDTEYFKTEKEIAAMYGKSQQSVNRSLKRAFRKGVLVQTAKIADITLYDTRTLPDTITGRT